MKKLFYLLSIMFVCLSYGQTQVNSLNIKNTPVTQNDTTNVDVLVREKGANKGNVKKVTWDYLRSVARSTYIKSNEPLTGAIRVGDVLYGILDQYTGEEINLEKITGSPTVDNIIYFQLGSEYFKRIYFNGINLKWFGVRTMNTASQNTTCILKALNYGMTQEVCDLFAPIGLYLVDPIHVPAFNTGNGRKKTVQIRGEVSPSQQFGTVAPQTLTDAGTIFKCESQTEGESLLYAEGIPAGGDFQFGFSSIKLVVKDIELRTYQNSKINALHAGWAAQFIAKDVQINNGVYSVNAVEPTFETTGVITPYRLNAALTILDNVSISGFRYGLEVNEHTDGRGLNITCNYYGLRIMEADHASYFALVDAQRNRYKVKVDGVQTIEIAQLNIEHAGVGQTTPENEWQKTIADIYDPLNKGRGIIKWASTMGAVGIDPNGFSRIGGDKYKYVNLYNIYTETPSGYDGGGFRFKPSTFNSASREWEIRTDITNFGDFGFRYFNTGTSTWINPFRMDLDGNMLIDGNISGSKVLKIGLTPSAISGSVIGSSFVVNEPNINALLIENKSTSSSADMRFTAKADDATYLSFSQPGSANVTQLLGINKNTSSFILSAGRALTLGNNISASVNIATNNLVRFSIDGSGNGNFTLPLTAPNATLTTHLATLSQVNGKVGDVIADGVTAIAPSQNATFDALALKANDNNVIKKTGELFQTVQGGVTVTGSLSSNSDLSAPTINTNYAVVNNAPTQPNEVVRLNDLTTANTGNIKQGGNSFGQGMLIGTMDSNSVTIAQGGAQGVFIDGSNVTLSRSKSNISGDLYLTGTTSGIKKADGTNYIVDGVINANSTTTITSSNFGGNGELIVYVDASTSALTLTLPTPADMQSRTVRVIKIDSSANAVTVKGNGTTNINGANTYLLTTQYQFTTVKTNGIQYYIF